MPLNKDDVPEVQLAAGGIVWRSTPQGAKLAVIHRPKYDDWSLPKGKPERGEGLGETAQREIREELGCGVKFLDFAGVVHYPLDDGRTKVVLFWHVTEKGKSEFQSHAEVDEVLWLPPDKALKKLSHEVERELLRKCRPPVL
jgi:8-oxo-dGTP pyrophosphatase MutT (NUDIX family)